MQLGGKAQAFCLHPVFGNENYRQSRPTGKGVLHESVGGCLKMRLPTSHSLAAGKNYYRKVTVMYQLDGFIDGAALAQFANQEKPIEKRRRRRDTLSSTGPFEIGR